MSQNIIIVADIHCRDFYKPVLNIKDKRIVFLGDYMDLYGYEGTHDEDGIANLEEIIDFAKNNSNVTLLTGNHDCSWIWSPLGFERTSYEFYNDLHRLYRDNITLFKPCLKVDNILFSHAGVCRGWIDSMNKLFKGKDSNFRLTESNIVPYIENEFELELQHDTALGRGFYKYLESEIFCIGHSRGGDAPYGGPFWSDFNYDYWDPEGWNLIQIMGHTQRIVTGTLGINGNGYCVDSRAIFEYDSESQTVSLWQGENSEKSESEE